MPPSKRFMVLMIVIPLVVVLVGVAAYRQIAYGPRIVEVTGTITWLDAETGEAAIEFVAPWSGKVHNRRQKVPENCPMTLNGEPTTLAELQPGDQATVKVEFTRRTKTIRPLNIAVTRQQPIEPAATRAAE